MTTDTGARLPDDRARAWTLWEGWRGYDVAEYMDALRQAFHPFTQYIATPTSHAGLIASCP